MRDDGQNINMGSPGRLVTPHSSNLPRKAVCVENTTTTAWLEVYPAPHTTARNTMLGLEKQVLWRDGFPKIIDSDNGTHFKNSLIGTWAREHWIKYNTGCILFPIMNQPLGKLKRLLKYNGLESNEWWDLQTLGSTF